MTAYKRKDKKDSQEKDTDVSIQNRASVYSETEEIQIHTYAYRQRYTQANLERMHCICMNRHQSRHGAIHANLQTTRTDT